MCGRYALYGPTSRLHQQFVIPDDIDRLPADITNPLARYNIAPSQRAPIIRADIDGTRHIENARWGLLPGWIRNPDKMPTPINARVETVAEKPMFRSAWRKSRIIVPASGYYEWHTAGGEKQPFFIHPTDDTLFALAGLLERHNDTLSFALLTTAANPKLATIHDRMPVILRPESYASWLDPTITNSDLVRTLAGQYPAESISAYPVGRAIGNPRSQGPLLIEPLPQT